MLKDIGCDHLGNLSGLNAWKLEDGFIMFVSQFPGQTVRESKTL